MDDLSLSSSFLLSFPRRRAAALAALFGLAGKRLFDIVVALSGMTLFLPALATVAVLIKLDSPGPIIFRQRRVGLDNRVFVISKFRTMRVCEDGDDLAQARPADPRTTRIGALLRRSSLDEMPQLWNVLKGEMSIVGPRPHALAHDQKYAGAIAEYPRRHRVKPGLTGAAQVRGFRGETRSLRQMEERIAWDLWYVDNWSLRLDLSIFLRTFVSLLVHASY